MALCSCGRGMGQSMLFKAKHLLLSLSFRSGMRSTLTCGRGTVAHRRLFHIVSPC